jgi:hypothetical protein
MHEPITRIFATIEQGPHTLTVSGPLALLAELANSLRADPPHPEAGPPPPPEVPEVRRGGQ